MEETVSSDDDIHVVNRVRDVAQWPTDTIEIDYYYYCSPPPSPEEDDDETTTTFITSKKKTTTTTTKKNETKSKSSNNNLLLLEYPHTIIVFFPGNPGLAGWYVEK